MELLLLSREEESGGGFLKPAQNCPQFVGLLVIIL